MLKRWDTFNESMDGRFTEEMAMEIVYYFSESSEPTKSISDLFFNNPETENLFNFYESGYDEYKEATQKLYGEVNRGSLDFRDRMLQVYGMIREERSAFPEICEIEDVFLDLIENSGFSFLVDTKEHSYKIKLYKDVSTMSEFISYCQLLEKITKRLETPTIKAILRSCQYNDSDPYGTNLWMEVLLRKKNG